VQLHRVAVAVDLGDAGEALDVAAGIDATNLSPERQVRLMIDVAAPTLEVVGRYESARWRVVTPCG
jgi:hypothetical protein